LAALEMAIRQRQPRAVVHHSDHGSQYTSIAFGNRCRQAGVQPSMGSVGDAYDNAMCESFFVSAKTTAPPMDDGQRDRFSKSLRSSCCGVKAR
jgi:transposase InsO family protein